MRRKASPRELAEAFKGHGLRQAAWAPVPIYWARAPDDHSPRAPDAPPMPPAAAGAAVQVRSDASNPLNPTPGQCVPDGWREERLPHPGGSPFGDTASRCLQGSGSAVSGDLMRF